VLVHSPLVGPETWAPVSEELERRGITAVVPDLLDNGRPPYWSRHAAAVADALAKVPPDRAVVLAGHSGAGPILPAIAAELRQPVAGYVFVDAGLPGDGRSRLEMMESESPDLARELREHLAAGGRFPDWTDADLAPLVPDVRQRTAFINDLRPRGLDFFSEPIPVPAQWQGDSRCGYLQLSSAYDRPARDAESQAWQVSRLAGDNHFLMLEDRLAVTMGLQDLMRQLGEPGLAPGRQ
jgi:pimeloyl-ACP methyl ester carboxylesterase